VRAAGVLYLAVTESSLASSVTRGENRGARLAHDNPQEAIPEPATPLLFVPALWLLGRFYKMGIWPVSQQ